MTSEELQLLLSAGVQHGASDIHFKVGDPPTYRVNGRLAQLNYDKLRPADTVSIFELLVIDPQVREQVASIQEYDTSYSLPGVARFRVNVYRQRGSLSMVLRLIPHKVPTVEELALPAVVHDIADSDRGLVLVTGATGSGKSTTLAAMINRINQTRSVHILTIEDPIEFLHHNVMASISQREIGIDTRNYQAGLRSALRQDPDIILIGEMRDAESIDIALKASETGHLVFSTVHTTDAAKTIGRVVSAFPAEEQQSVRYRLADNLRATISLRLLARAEGKGRVAAAEIMVVTKTVQEHIRDASKTERMKDVIEKGSNQYRMQSFDQHLTQLYREGKITIETALSAATSPADFQRALDLEASYGVVQLAGGKR